MRLLGTTAFKLPPEFGAWFKADEHLEVVRYYCSSQTRTYMLWNALLVFDPTNKWAKQVDAEVLRWAPGNNIREACLCLTSTRSWRKPEFVAHNYLDSIGPRLHIVTTGKGVYEQQGTRLEIKASDVLLFDQSDFGRPLSRSTSEDTQELVFCLGASDGRTNWQLFRDYHEAKARK